MAIAQLGQLLPHDTFDFSSADRRLVDLTKISLSLQTDALRVKIRSRATEFLASIEKSRDESQALCNCDNDERTLTVSLLTILSERAAPLGRPVVVRLPITEKNVYE